MKPVRVSQRAIVQGVGIDFNGDQYQLTLQIFDAKGGGAQTSIDASKPNCMILQAEGTTISEALEEATLKQGKQIFYGQNKMIVVGEQVAKQGLDIAVNYFNSNHQSRPNVDVVMANGRASDVVSAELGQSILPILSIRNMLENTEVNGKILRGQVLHIVDAKENGYTGTFMPIVARSKNGEKEEGMEVVGTAIYRHNKLAGKVDPTYTRGILWLRNQVKGTHMVVNHEKLGKMSLEVVSAKTKIKTSIVNGVPHFTIDCKVKSHIEESIMPSGGTTLLSHIGEIEKLQSATIYSEMEGALSSCLSTYRSDVFDFANLLEKYEPKWFNENKARYDELLPQFTYQINMHTTITRYGLQS